MIAAMDRLARSLGALLALIGLAAIVVALAGWPAPSLVVGILALVLVIGAWRIGRSRPEGVVTAVALVAVLSCVLSLRAHDAATIWVALTAGLAVAVGLAQGPIHQRVVPRLRAVNLPGVPSDPRVDEPGALAPIVPGAAAALALLVIAATVWQQLDVVSLVVLLLLLGGTAGCVIRLRGAVRARRDGSIDEDVNRALARYAPKFFVYFSGTEHGDYQVRMWLPYLERLGVPFAILARNPAMLPRAGALTSAPLICSPRVTGLDACMVDSVRAVFYVNNHSDCVDGVRYLDRTHVHLNHGDSDKPSSYHPIFGMFDRNFVAGQAAIDRFARHGVSVPADRFVIVGRPQVAAVTEHNTDPVPGRRTVLYAPTWQSGMREMSLSSVEQGERIVRALLDAGVRVIFRPHPLSRGQRRAARTIDRIDALLATATTPECPHMGSSQALAEGIIDNFNRSDAMVADVSSVVSDYLASCKPVAAVLPGGTRQRADPEEYPMLRATYPLDLTGDIPAELDALLGVGDPLASARRELRTYYLGDDPDSVGSFLAAAAAAIGN